MPRRNRVFLEGGIFHVYNRTGRGEMVFADEAEASAFVEQLRMVKARDGLQVFAWCLMSNHYHIALRCGPIPLSRPMKSLQQGVTRGYNARRRVFGPMWQGRYRARLVEEQRYLDGLLAYIHLNPVTAGLVDDPAEYRWSGHQEILGRARKPITDCDEVLGLFGKTRRSARQAYVRAIKGTAVEPWAGEDPGGLPWWRLGRPRTEEIESPRADSTVAVVDGLGRSTGLERPRFEAADFVARIAARLELRLQDLAGKQRAPDLVRARELVATLAIERYGLRVKEIAAVLNKSAEAVSRMVSRGTAKRQDDAEFKDRYEELDLSIALPCSR
jgi:REP element-mobilizing transposase RayT